ncbi:putative esterase/lipase/thioesterase [Calothrix parasitica NIES-267]|uniref:Putative esterase/lipase/thioesterase n=1 Tax=Calothrix parasitica NIES-267 TaxID=1973488 RepID=A0A1Z4LJ75_9CYAN|nr:putative esterase/lipase/thioesterase [Calothrix parasitica NIES-267]
MLFKSLNFPSSNSRKAQVIKPRKFVNRALSLVAISGSSSVIAKSISASARDNRGTKKESPRDAQQSDILTLEEILTFPDVPGNRRVLYGSDPSQFGELYLPQKPGPHPVVVLVHGGCWLAEYGLNLMGQMAAALKEEGLAVWNLEYRRLGNGGGWTGTFEDVALGTDFLRTIAPQFNLDLSRLVTVGHSAGGHLALWLAGRRNLPNTSSLYKDNSLPVRGVVSLAGIPDLITGVEQNICLGSIQQLVGGLPSEVPGRYKQASPRELLPLKVPQWHLSGKEDEIVPTSYIKEYVKVAKRYDQVYLDVLRNAGHFELIYPNTSTWSKVRHAIKDILQRNPKAP